MKRNPYDTRKMVFGGFAVAVGWYWLGHDAMHDTMHFEFLGVPPT